MKRTLAALVALCALSGLNVNADASVVSTFTVTPGAISAGGSSALDLLLTLSADPGYFNAQFTGGSVTLNSGIGPSQVFTVPSGVSAPQDFNFSLNYPTAGNYTPSFSYTADYSEQYAVYQQTGTQYISQGYWHTYSYSCGFLSTCYGENWVDTSYYAPVYGYVDYTAYSSNSDSGNGSLLVTGAISDIAATPLPATLPLFVSGLGGLGLLGWRRKRKNSAALAPA